MFNVFNRRISYFKGPAPECIVTAGSTGDAIRPQLEPAYSRYVAKYSTPDMAASLELSSYLVGLCIEKKAQTILDLGSGFTSYALRFYKSNYAPNAYVASVDDAPDWCQVTRQFLADEKETDSQVFEFSSFVSEADAFTGTNYQTYDVVLHDLGNMTTRINQLEKAAQFVSPDGILVLDDMHKSHYREPALRKMRELKFNVVSLADSGTDSFGRYAAVAWR